MTLDDLALLTRAAWAADRGGCLAVFSIFALVWMAGLLGSVFQ